ncbi:MAG: class I SAM-dependent methyltransferase [Pseudomonadota bacterium]
MPNARSFWDKAARKYAAAPIRDEESYAKTLERVRARLAPTDRVLELGCGTGTTAMKLADTAAHITATDVSDEMIAIANEKKAAAGLVNVDFAVAGVGAAPAGRFDAVLAFNLFHLVDDMPAALAAVRERVAEGGYFISKTPCLAEKKGFLKPVIALMKWIGKAPPTVAFLTIAAVDDAIEAAGFDIVETADLPVDFPSRFVVARRR